MLGYPHLHPAMCGLTQHCYHLEGLGLRTETPSTGCSRDQQAGLGRCAGVVVQPGVLCRSWHGGSGSGWDQPCK